MYRVTQKEATLRSWIDSEKKFFDKNIAYLGM